MILSQYKAFGLGGNEIKADVAGSDRNKLLDLDGL